MPQTGRDILITDAGSAGSPKCTQQAFQSSDALSIWYVQILESIDIFKGIVVLAFSLHAA